MQFKIDLQEGKYTYVFNKGDQHALRYGEPWKDLLGDNLVHSMACRIKELEELLKVFEERSKSIREIEDRLKEIDTYWGVI